MKSEGNSNDHRDRTRALHVSTPDSVRGISPGHEGSSPMATRFLLVQQREERLPLQLLWASVRYPGRTRRRAEGPAEWRRLQRAYQPVSQAYGCAREGRQRLRAAVGRKLQSAMGVSASWWSWSEGFVARGTHLSDQKPESLPVSVFTAILRPAASSALLIPMTERSSGYRRPTRAPSQAPMASRTMRESRPARRPTADVLRRSRREKGSRF